MKLPLKEYIRRAKVGDIIEYSRVHGYLRVQRIVHYMGRIECVSAKYWSSDGISKIYHIGMDNGGDVVVIHQPAAELCKCDHCTGGKSAYDKAEAWNKEANEEVNKAMRENINNFLCGIAPHSVVVVEFRNEKPQKPLGDDFSMLRYFRILKASVCEYQLMVGPSKMVGKTLKRLNALIKIWEWKEKNDGKSGGDWYVAFNKAGEIFEVLGVGASTPRGRLDVSDGILGTNFYYTNTELPRFSSFEIADRALKVLEQEYKIVFNVK